MSHRCFLFVALAAVLSMLVSVAAESSPSQPQILISEGTFVRGVMAANHQFANTGPIYAKSSDFYAKLNVLNLNVTNLY